MKAIVLYHSCAIHCNKSALNFDFSSKKARVEITVGPENKELKTDSTHSVATVLGQWSQPVVIGSQVALGVYQAVIGPQVGL